MCFKLPLPNLAAVRQGSLKASLNIKDPQQSHPAANEVVASATEQKTRLLKSKKRENATSVATQYPANIKSLRYH